MLASKWVCAWVRWNLNCRLWLDTGVIRKSLLWRMISSTCLVKNYPYFLTIDAHSISIRISRISTSLSTRSSHIDVCLSSQPFSDDFDCCSCNMVNAVRFERLICIGKIIFVNSSVLEIILNLFESSNCFISHSGTMSM